MAVAMSAAMVALKDEIKVFQKEKPTRSTPYPNTIRVKVIKLLKKEKLSAYEFGRKVGLNYSIITAWNPRLKTRAYKKSKKEIDIPARQGTLSLKPDDGIAELVNTNGDILRLPINDKTLPFIIAEHYGRDSSSL